MACAKPNLHVYATAEALSLAAADLFLAIGRQAVADTGRFTVALAGGSTPRRLYELLAENPHRAGMDWAAVEWFFGDERAVPPDHPDSNYRMARAALLDPVFAPAGRVHRMAAEGADLPAAAAGYQAVMARVFGADSEGSPPVFDLVLLGMGDDGHTASLFPYTEALRVSDAWVAANEVPQLRSRRMTLTFPLINNAANVLFLVAGSDKTGVLAEVLEGPADHDRLPSQRVVPVTGNLLWYVDDAAAGQLTCGSEK